MRHRFAGERGMVLVITLWVLMVLLVLAVSFLGTVNSQTRLAAGYGQEAQAEFCAKAGLVRALQAILLDETPNTPLGEAWFQIDSASEGIDVNGWRYLVFVEDLSGRLNANTATPEMLLNLLGDEILVDSLLDWIDTDDQPRPNGAESDYYTQLDPPYRAKNGPLESIEELLLVANFTREMVYGTAALEGTPWAAAQPMGASQEGFTQWTPLLYLLTPYSGDVNLTMEGLERINLRTATQEEMQQRLGEVLTEQEIQRLIEYREGTQQQGQQAQQGPQGQQVPTGGQPMAPTSPAPTPTFPGPFGGGAMGGGPPVSRQQPSPPGTGMPSMPSLGQGAGPTQTPAPAMTPSVPAEVQEAQQVTEGQGQQGGERFRSLGELLPLLGRDKTQQILDQVTVRSEHFLPGLVNINTARKEVLLSLPGMTEEVADDILDYRQNQGGFQTLGELLTLPSVTDELFQQIVDWLTVRSAVFRIVVRAVSPDGRWHRDLEVVVWVDQTPLSAMGMEGTTMTSQESSTPSRTIEIVEWKVER